MIQKCDGCGSDIECDTCDQPGASPNNHWHTCDLLCAEELAALVLDGETQKQYRQRRAGAARPVPYSVEEFQDLLCDECRAIFDDNNEISPDEMCDTCRATIAIRDNPSAMRALKDANVKL